MSWRYTRTYDLQLTTYDFRMSNNYFQFKQFRIDQEHCAMKVTTDACIQGAWTPVLPQVKRVLDVGAGTGLLSLMLAQRNNDVIIDGIEFDKAAATQAAENVVASPWKDRINIIEGDAVLYTAPHKYDLIISNPPFFNNSLLSDKDNKNMARHTLSLTYEGLLDVLQNNLAEDGYTSIMLPFTEYQQWKELLFNSGWYESMSLAVSNNFDSPAKRVVGLFSKKKVEEIKEKKLVIRDADNNYMPAFTALLSPFYLNL